MRRRIEGHFSFDDQPWRSLCQNRRAQHSRRFAPDVFQRPPCVHDHRFDSHEQPLRCGPAGSEVCTLVPRGHRRVDTDTAEKLFLDGGNRRGLRRLRLTRGLRRRIENPPASVFSGPTTSFTRSASRRFPRYGGAQQLCGSMRGALTPTTSRCAHPRARPGRRCGTAPRPQPTSISSAPTVA